MPAPSPFSAPRSALVVGGAGFVGTRLLRALSDAGAVHLVSADVSTPESPVPGVEYVHQDARARLEIDGDFDVVYNLAAVHRTPGHPDREYFEANVASAVNVTNFCRSRGIGSIVFTSSIAVYGPDETPKTESTAPTPTSSYGRSKLLAEQIHDIWLEEDADRRLVIVRPAVIFGRGEHGNFDRLLKLVRGRRFVYPGRTDTVKACGYVGELVRSLEWVRLLGERRAVYNFCYPERTTIQEIVDTIAEFTGSPRPRIVPPLGAMMTAAHGFELLASVGVRTGIHRERILKLVRSTNIVPQFLLERAYPFETDLRGGIAAWLREEGVLPAPGRRATKEREPALGLRSPRG
jgi:nucleoside-diphosphate-sugar epimerase